MPDEIPALAWLPDFAASIGRASLGSLASVRVQDDVDPLKKYVILTFHHKVPPYAPQFIRALLSEWAEVNNCAYRRSEYDGREFKALVLLKQLRPASRVNPFTDKIHERDRRRSGRMR